MGEEHSTLMCIYKPKKKRVLPLGPSTGPGKLVAFGGKVIGEYLHDDTGGRESIAVNRNDVRLSS